MSIAQIDQADLTFAKAIIIGMRPFSLYESKEIKDMFTKLSLYYPPLKDKVGGRLLDTLKEQV